jgi:hypothetical protein
MAPPLLFAYLKTRQLEELMPIFGNRTLAAMLRDLSLDVRERCQADLVGRLDNGGYEAIAAEWELFVLRQMSLAKSLRLPPRDRPGVPDAIFTPSGLSPVVVEVTALNDQDLEENFADDALGMLFYRAINRLTGRHVGSIDVHTNWPVGADGLPTSGLPPRSQLHKFMQSPEVRQFVRAVASAPTESRGLEHRQGNTTTTVIFRPGAQYSRGSVSGYAARSFNSHNHGRLLRKLRRKVKQLSASNLQLPGVVVLCDANCRMLQEPLQTFQTRESAVHAIFDFISGRPTRSLPGPGQPWIIERGAQQQTTSINAVVVLTIDEQWNHWPINRVQRSLKVSVIKNLGKCKYPLDDSSLQAFVGCLTSSVPPILRMPMNAKHIHPMSDNEGGGSVINQRIRFSKLALQDLLTGRTSYEKFVERHGFIAEHLIRLTERGQSIAGASVVKDENGRDDDWIEFDFSGTDPRHLRHLLERGDN